MLTYYLFFSFFLSPSCFAFSVFKILRFFKMIVFRWYPAMVVFWCCCWMLNVECWNVMLWSVMQLRTAEIVGLLVGLRWLSLLEAEKKRAIPSPLPRAGFWILPVERGKKNLWKFRTGWPASCCGGGAHDSQWRVAFVGCYLYISGWFVMNNFPVQPGLRRTLFGRGV